MLCELAVEQINLSTELVYLIILAIIGCIASLLAFFAGIDLAKMLSQKWKERLKVLLLILVSYVCFVLVAVYVVPTVFEAFWLHKASVDEENLFSMFILPTLLLISFLVMGKKYSKDSSKTIEQTVNDAVSKERNRTEQELSNLEMKIEEVQRHIEETDKTLASNRILLDGISRQLDALKIETQRHIDQSRKQLEEQIRLTKNVSQGVKEVEIHSESTQTTKDNIERAHGLPEKVAETEPIQSAFDDSKLPERAKRLLPKARISLQTKDVSRDVLVLLPVKISRVDYQPIHHRIILEILDLTADNVKPTISAISSRTHINKQELKTLLQEMINNGFIKTEVEGKTVFYFPAKSEFIKNLYQPVFKTRREGGEIAFELLKRAKDDWRDSHRDSLFITLRQIPNKDMPDAVVIPPLLKGEREGWSFFDAVAIEIETPEEIRAHPEQVLYNMVKNFAIGFKKVQFYCSTDSFDKLIGLSQRLPTDIEEIIASSVVCFKLK
jgi:predicted transcriptional regulator/ribosomal protein S15P/S13E